MSTARDVEIAIAVEHGVDVMVAVEETGLDAGRAKPTVAVLTRRDRMKVECIMVSMLSSMRLRHEISTSEEKQYQTGNK